MSDEDAMLKAVLANPEDDTARLVYADAVQEHDEDLAQLIRRGVPCHCVSADQPRGLPGCYQCGSRRWLDRCEEPGCKAAGFDCWIDRPADDHSPEEAVVYCGEHATLHGFCSCCGAFWAGVDSFESTGLCDHCRHELRDDEHEWDDDGFHEYGVDHA